MQALPNLLTNVPKLEGDGRPEQSRIQPPALGTSLPVRRNDEASSFQEVLDIVVPAQVAETAKDTPSADQPLTDTSKNEAHDPAAPQTVVNTAPEEPVQVTHPKPEMGVRPVDIEMVPDQASIASAQSVDAANHKRPNQDVPRDRTGDLTALQPASAPTIALDPAPSGQVRPKTVQAVEHFISKTVGSTDGQLQQANALHTTPAAPALQETHTATPPSDVKALASPINAQNGVTGAFPKPTPVEALATHPGAGAPQQPAATRVERDQPRVGHSIGSSPTTTPAPAQTTIQAEDKQGAGQALPTANVAERLPRAEIPRTGQAQTAPVRPTPQTETLPKQRLPRVESTTVKVDLPVAAQRTIETAGSMVDAAFRNAPAASPTFLTQRPIADLPATNPTRADGGFHPKLELPKGELFKAVASPSPRAETIAVSPKNPQADAQPVLSGPPALTTANRQQDLQLPGPHPAPNAPPAIIAATARAPMAPQPPVMWSEKGRVVFETMSAEPIHTTFGAHRADATSHTPVVQTNAAARADLPHQVVRQIAEAAAGLPNRPVDITLSPEELGRVRLSLSLTETGITVSLAAERPETMDLLRRHIDLLGQDFASLGFDDIAFDFNQGDAPAAEDEGSASAAEVTEEDTPHQIHLRSGPSSGLDLRL